MKKLVSIALIAALFAGCAPIAERAADLDDIYWEGASWIDADEITIETSNRKAIHTLFWMVESDGAYALFVNDHPLAEGAMERARVTYDLTWGVRAEPTQRNRFVIRRAEERKPIRAVVDVVYTDGSEDVFTATP